MDSRHRVRYGVEIKKRFLLFCGGWAEGAPNLIVRSIYFLNPPFAVVLWFGGKSLRLNGIQLREYARFMDVLRSMYLWSKLSGAQWIDAWEERFSGNANFVIQYIKGGRSVRLQVYCGSKKEADTIFEQFGGSVRKVKDADWKKAPEPPKPLKVRDVFLVTAETNKQKLTTLQKNHPKRELIVIPPEMAFGTGDHATTSTCMRFLVDIARERKDSKWSVADLGSGTGLLAIAAAKLGADEVWGCDFDPLAIGVAKRNAERNGTPDIGMKQQDVLKWKPRKKGYDVVLANLFSTVLIEAWPVIAKSLGKGGDLVVSGILASQAWEVFEGAAKEGIGFSKVVKKGKWVTARGGWFEDIAPKK